MHRSSDMREPRIPSHLRRSSQPCKVIHNMVGRTVVQSCRDCRHKNNMHQSTHVENYVNAESRHILQTTKQIKIVPMSSTGTNQAGQTDKQTKANKYTDRHITQTHNQPGPTPPTSPQQTHQSRDRRCVLGCPAAALLAQTTPAVTRTRR